MLEAMTTTELKKFVRHKDQTLGPGSSSVCLTFNLISCLPHRTATLIGSCSLGRDVSDVEPCGLCGKSPEGNGGESGGDKLSVDN